MREPENALSYSKQSVRQNRWLLWMSAINVLLNTLSASAIALISALSDAGLIGAVDQAASTLKSLFT